MAAREPSSVLRIKRTDIKDAFIILLCYNKGRGDLDLELVASEGENAWATTIKESRAGQLKASNNQASDEAWVEVLKSGLLLAQPSTEFASEVSGLEIVSTITKDQHINIVFRRNVGELTQRLGTIDLSPSEDIEFDLWTGCAASARFHGEAKRQADDLDAKLAEQIESNRKLRGQLQELIQAKEDSENALFQKFTELLNSKKLKIREQQRLLAIAKVDEEKLNKVVEAQDASSNRKAGSSRSSKRKAPSAAVASEDESSDGFEDVPDQDDEERRQASTPEPPEDLDDTAEDSDAPDPTPPPPPKKGIKKTLAGRGKVPAPSTSQSLRTPRKATPSQDPAEHEDLPPRRELPFSRRKAAREVKEKMSQDPLANKPASRAKSASEAVQSSGAGDDDDTTDDEL